MIWLMRVVIQIVVLLIVDGLLESVEIDDLSVAIVAALIMLMVNAVVRPVLIVMTLPITVLSFGLFLFVINGITYWVTSAMIPGFEVDGFSAAIGAAIISTILTFSLRKIADEFVILMKKK